MCIIKIIALGGGFAGLLEHSLDNLCSVFSCCLLKNSPVKRSPGSDHEVGDGEVNQVEVDRRPHRLVEDHLVPGSKIMI